jgi:chemotaxis protein CheY-P-specific phosphatase CheC
MRCFFHLVSTYESIIDETGIEVANLVAMQRQVAQAIQELRQTTDHDEANWRDWQLNVVDEAGNLRVSIPLGVPLV